MRMIRYILTLTFMFFLLIGYSQENQDSSMAVQIEEIVLYDIRTQGPLPWSYSKQKANETDKFQNNVRQLMDRQPGIQSFNGENFAQDVRISIRGYGSRSAFGIRGIKIYQDGLPLTSPDGTSQLDEISVFDIESVDIVRSGLAARLGNAGGGALSFRLNDYFDGVQLLSRVNTLGAYDGGIKYGVSGKKYKNVFSFNHHFFKGKRDFSEAQNTTLLNKTRIDISEKWQISFTHGAYHSPTGKDPGALSADEFTKNRYEANARNITFDAGESVSGLLMSGRSIYSKSDQSTFISGYFYRYRDFTGRLPFMNGGWVDLNRHFGGFSNTYEYRPSDKLIFSIGQTLEFQSDRRILSTNNNGIKSTLSADQYEKVLNAALFQQLQYNYKKWSLHQMLRWDFNQYQLNDNFNNSDKNNGEKRYKNLNGSFGAGYLINKQLTLFSNINTTFEMPTLNELSNNPELTGGFNTSLNPETSFQKEAGLKWEPNTNFSINISAFQIDIQDQITGYEIKDAPGRTFYRNASSSSRTGIECSADIQINTYLKSVVNYTFSKFKYNDFITGSSNFSGNIQPLIPSHKWNFITIINADNWGTSQINVSYNSAIFVDDANKTKVNGFYEINGAIHTGSKISSKFTAGITANNLFNLMDYSNFRANATLGRYYEAASPQNFSLFVKYTF
jgi:iron complex outermembrane recepter protein